MHIARSLLLVFLIALSFNSSIHAEEVQDYEPWFDDKIDLNPFNMKGLSLRYAYLDFDNYIGYTHYVGAAYYKKSGAESEGFSARVGIGTLGTKYNLSYSNAFSFMHVDFGLSLYDLNSRSDRTLKSDESISIEMGLRMWVVQIVANHFEDMSFVTFGYGF